ncbi:RNA 2',3'-cyclic phosphodiesterase [Paenibacillus lentus]|uniref:RNA 2',3'-cyclic phosphodiesterase n=1 Tax=Paenibacillus lentus TaxID=1338368 RepID=A0A3S8RUF2_9BACL|nr:RNA 2',3'-cyclic phosphodiesterase [Paenibacillus lentus]AZK46377.1 RNA 2',3'-cyclic phosphodiesterase [Paenibacillus lentus]
MSPEGEKWRLFVAVPLPNPVKERLHSWCLERQNDLKFRRWVHPADYHITLQFLGDTPPEKVAPILEVLQKAAAEIEPFRLEAAGIGVFGSPSRPRVLWSGVQGEMTSLHQLHSRVTAANAELGYVPEERPYAPHITLARKFSEGARLQESLLNKGLSFGDWTNDTILVYRTRVTVSPMYEVVGIISLQK